MAKRPHDISIALRDLACGVLHDIPRLLIVIDILDECQGHIRLLRRFISLVRDVKETISVKVLVVFGEPHEPNRLPRFR